MLPAICLVNGECEIFFGIKIKPSKQNSIIINCIKAAMWRSQENRQTTQEDQSPDAQAKVEKIKKKFEKNMNFESSIFRWNRKSLIILIRLLTFNDRSFRCWRVEHGPLMRTLTTKWWIKHSGRASTTKRKYIQFYVNKPSEQTSEHSGPVVSFTEATESVSYFLGGKIINLLKIMQLLDLKN